MTFNQIDAGGADYTLALKDNLSKALAASMNAATASVKSAAKIIDAEFKALGRQMQSVGNIVAGVGASMTALGAASTFGLGKAIQDAGEFGETLSMFENVFKDQSDAVRDWAQVYGKEVRRAGDSLLGFLANAQDTFVPLGFDRKEAAELSKTVTKLTVDLSSFKNMSEWEAFNRIIGALVGNTENLRAFGVVANESAIQMQALSMGFDPDNLTAYEKALAILELTMNGTKDAQGDAARTADEYANVIRDIKSQLKEMSKLIGEDFKDAVAAVGKELAKMLEAINELLRKFPVLRNVIGATGIAMIALGSATTGVGLYVSSLGKAFATFGVLSAISIMKTRGLMQSLAVSAKAASDAIKATGTAAAAAGKAGSASGGAAGAARGILFEVGQLIGGLATTIRRNALRGIFGSLLRNLMRFGKLTFSVLGRVLRFAVGWGGKLARVLANPFAAAAAVAVLAMKGIEYVFKRQEAQGAEFGKTLEARRQASIAKLLADSGLPVPENLENTFDPNKARLATNEPKPQRMLTKFEGEVFEAIEALGGEFKMAAEQMAAARELLDRGMISQAQFARYAKEVQSTLPRNPLDEMRREMQSSLAAPVEILLGSLQKAAILFKDSPVFLERARKAAIEQFRTTDPIVQLFKSLQTPMEVFQDRMKEINDLFKKDSDFRRRAVQQAKEQFRATDPFELLKQSVMTPAEQLGMRLREISRIIGGRTDPEAMEIGRRARKQARDQFNSTDPAATTAQAIKDAIKGDATRIAEQIGEAFKLIGKGISRSQFEQYRKQLIEGFLGERPDPQFASMASTSSRLAAQLGAFAPALDKDRQREMAEYEKKQIQLQTAMAKHLKEINDKRGVLL